MSTTRSAEKRKEYRDRFVARHPERQLEYDRKRNFGITPEQWAEMSKDGCEVCGSFERLVTDHDHSCCPHYRNTCGRCLRGVLCHHCNTAIGLFHDDPIVMARAIEYLTREVPNDQLRDEVQREGSVADRAAALDVPDSGADAS